MFVDLMVLHCKMRRTTNVVRKTRSHNKQTRKDLIIISQRTFDEKDVKIGKA